MNVEHFGDLCQRYFLETISKEEMIELDSLLNGNKGLRLKFAAASRLDTNLRDAASSFERKKDKAESSITRGYRKWHLGMSAVAALVLIAILVSQFYPGSFSDESSGVTEGIARIADLNGAVTWIADGEQTEGRLKVGNELTGGTLEVSSLDSWAKIVFRDSSTVWVSGPAVVTISDGGDGKMIRLREGDLSLDVSPQPEGKPMRVITPSAEAVVLGTQFNVSASSSSTSLTVNEGTVQVTRLADGSVQEVEADHGIVAALEHESPFQASPRGDSVRIWKSEYPRDVRQGSLRFGAEGHPDVLRAETHLFRGDYGEKIDPILLHSAVVGPAAGKMQPVLLSKEARFLIQGHLDQSFQVSFGFGTHHARGGLSGKFSTDRKIEVEPDTDGYFEVELTLADFRRLRSRFVESPVGHELGWFWVQTTKKDVGLSVYSVELFSPEPISK
jgi:ferric-dicitrate binding protein FerR (iron transport regulator)